MTEYPAISESSGVVMNFAIRLEDGSEIESTFGQQALIFCMGDGSLLPGFEQALLGLKQGDHVTLDLLPEQGFGMPDPEQRSSFRRELLEAEAPVSVGTVIRFEDNPMPGVVVAVTGEELVVDFNHPLAGKNLKFEVEIIHVEAGG